MREILEMTGMVIKVSSVGEYDRRMVILTWERGKITVFARGAKRPGSSLMGPSRPFAFGKFKLYEGRDSYTLQSADIGRYFEELAGDMEGACYGQYFLEMADYYTRENVDGSGMLLLVYQSLRALLKPRIPNELVRRVFELKAMVVNGEYTQKPPVAVSDSAGYTWEYVVASPMEKLYTFVVTDEVLEEFGRCVDRNKECYIDREFCSLGILKALTAGEKGVR
ncbi:MAG: DNA repair protein RecO [Hungatella sp.]|jgi:DNA repair protein RecO (recombination protein O)|nr:DNA repair protein RecO [Hungatella sp.]